MMKHTLVAMVVVWAFAVGTTSHRAVAADAASAPGTYTNPVLTDRLADPCVIGHEDRYYLYGTGDRKSVV